MESLLTASEPSLYGAAERSILLSDVDEPKTLEIDLRTPEPYQRSYVIIRSRHGGFRGHAKQEFKCC